jgi:holliday junction DNA helicase RuvB
VSTMQELLESQGLNGLYPTDWDGFIGQAPVKRQLRVAATSARMRGAAMSHVLLASGEAGCGKTTLALLTATELGTKMQAVSGRIDLNDARIVLAGLQDGDVLFIDEFHTLFSRGKSNAEWLLHLLQDGVLMGPHGPEEQPDITVIAATTDAGKLPDTFLTRFKLQPVIEPYDDDSATRIAIQMGAQTLLRPLPWPSIDNFHAIARAGNNNPRTIGSILSNLRDITLVEPHTFNEATQAYDLTEALEWLGLSPDGLTKQARAYLQIMLTEFGGQAGERALSDRLNEPGGVRHIERLLLSRGYIARTRSGRVLTKDGILRARLEEAA